MLNRMTLMLIGGALFCGCADSPENTAEDRNKPAPTSETKPVSQESADDKDVKATAIDHKFEDPHEVLVPGQITVDLMGMAVPKRAEALGQKFKQAMAKDPNWLLEYSKKNKNRKPGTPLPYDAKMGLSKAEYEEFLVLSKKMTMQKQKEIPLIITAKGDDVFVLHGGKELSDFTGIEIDLKNEQVQTPFGTLTKRSIINAPEHTALGAWNGIQWMMEKPDPNGITGTVAKLAVGKLKQSGRCVIYYDVRKATPDAKTRISHVLNYDAP